jgi:hypothetical protein
MPSSRGPMCGASRSWQVQYQPALCLGVPHPVCMSGVYNESSWSDASHIVADPLYAPSGGYNKNLLLRVRSLMLTDLCVRLRQTVRTRTAR